MAWLGLDDDLAMELYHRMRMSRLPSEYALLGDTAAVRLARMRETLDAKLRSLPRFAYPEFRSRYQVGGPMKASSGVFNDIAEDADELAKMVVLSAEIVARLAEKFDDQMELHAEICMRLEAMRMVEDEAVEALPNWTVEAARMIEAMGFDRLSFRSKGRQIMSEFREVLERHSTPEAVVEKTLQRMSDRLAHSIDSAPDDDDQVVDVVSDIDDSAAFPLDAAIPVPFDGDVPSGSVSAIRKAAADTLAEVPAGRTVEAFLPYPIGAKTASEPSADDVRSGGFVMIEGIESEHRFEGMFSQFERGEASPLDASRKARMEEREGFQLSSVKVVDGVLPDAAWLRYEVPYGDYVLVQMKGASSVLPRLRDAASLADPAAGMVSGMFPPFASMARFGEMVGVSEKELRLLAAWDAPGIGEGHMWPSVLDGGRGDPAQAYYVMKRAVALHLSSVLGADEVGRIAPVTLDHMARFWLFLTVGRMRPAQLELMWPGGFFHGVEGHDVGVGNDG